MVERFSSKSELDSSITFPKNQSRHSDDHSNIQIGHSKLTKHRLPGRGKTRTKRVKRGDSLERAIAKLILNEAPRTHALHSKGNIAGVLSPKEILSDLSESHRFATKSNRTSECNFDASTTLGHYAESYLEILPPRQSCPTPSFDSDVFNFNIGNEEWATFDDCPIFGTQPKPTEELDGNGFPAFGEAKDDEEKIKTVDFGSEIKREISSSDAPSKVHKGNEVEKNTDKAKATETDPLESCSRISCDENSERSDSRTSLLQLFGNSKGQSYDFESTQSPSSVADFATKDAYNAAIAHPKLTWSPKPPKHFTRSKVFLK